MLKQIAEDLSPELYNIEDIVFTMKDSKRRTEVTLVAKGERDINLIRYYLALKDLVEKIERELGVMTEFDGDPQ